MKICMSIADIPRDLESYECPSSRTWSLLATLIMDKEVIESQYTEVCGFYSHLQWR